MLTHAHCYFPMSKLPSIRGPDMQHTIQLHSRKQKQSRRIKLSFPRRDHIVSADSVSLCTISVDKDRGIVTPFTPPLPTCHLRISAHSPATRSMNFSFLKRLWGTIVCQSINYIVENKNNLGIRWLEIAWGQEQRGQDT